MVRLSLVLRRLLLPGKSEILPACPQCVLYHNGMPSLRPGVQTLSNALTDGLGCGDMTGLLQDHRLKEDEPLRVPPSVLHYALLWSLVSDDSSYV